LRWLSKLTAKEQNLLEVIKVQCSEAVNAAKQEACIWRGVQDHDEEVILVNPAATPRKSANISNYYTLCIDNLPNWSAFPKRSRSMICSTNRKYASEYGQLYLVLPLNGAKIGITGERDIWDVTVKNPETCCYCDTLRHVNYWFQDVEVNDTSWNTFLASISQNTQGERFIQELLSQGSSRQAIISQLMKIYDPSTLGMSVSTMVDFGDAHDYDVEVWTDSKSYMIREGSDLFLQIKAIIEKP